MIEKPFMKRFVWLALAGFIAIGALARADMIPPDEATCEHRRAGAACETGAGRSGICQMAKCGRIDYTDQGPRGTVEYDCLKCVERKDGGSDGWNSGNGGSGVTGAGSVARAVGPWFLAGLFSVPLLIKRRRRNRPD